MKKIPGLLPIVLAIAFASHLAIAQSSFHDTVVSYYAQPPGSGAHDYWLAVPANYYEGGNQKYIRIYISCVNNTAAYIKINPDSQVKGLPIKAFNAIAYDVPITVEMQGSGFVENKAIHVYDPTDNVSVFFMSHDPYSADGSFLLPRTEWGRDYIVAGFATVNEGGASTYSDIPNEFTISAYQDNTIVEIIPSADCREGQYWEENITGVAFPKGKPTYVTLNHGQCIQFVALFDVFEGGHDLTGTIIHSNNPVAVIGASQCAEIPNGNPYCDFVCHEVLPVSSWGKTYYTTPFVQTNVPALKGHDSSMFLLVSSKDSQTINRYDSATGDHIVCTIDTALHIQWIEATHASKWYSDAPFLLVQYINGTTYPDGNNGTAILRKSL